MQDRAAVKSGNAVFIAMALDGGSRHRPCSLILGVEMIDEERLTPKIKASLIVASLFGTHAHDQIPYYVMRDGKRVLGGYLDRFTPKAQVKKEVA